MEPISTDSFISRYCTVLNFDEELTNIAVDIAKKACDLGGVAGRCPLSIAGYYYFYYFIFYFIFILLIFYLFYFIAASIYMVCLSVGRYEEKKKIAELIGVAEITIANSYRIMYAYRHQLFAPNLSYQQYPILPDNLPPS